MNPKHTTNALIPVPVQDLAKAIQSATSVESLKRYEEAAEGILGGRIQPTDLRRVLAVERTGGSGGGPFRRRRSSRLPSRSTSVPDPSADLATQLSAAKDQLTEANNKLTEALNELKEKENELALYKIDLTDVSDELEQVKEDLDLTKKDLEACEDRENLAGDASAREASLQTEISRLKTDLLNAKASLTTAQTDKQDSQREVNAKNVELRQKDDLIVSKDAEISSLNMKIISLNTEITELSELLGKCDREKRAEAEKIRKKTEEDLKKAEKAAEEKAVKERVARELAARQSMPPPAPKPADQAVERDGPDTMLDTADENDLSDLLGDNSTPEPVKVEAAKCITTKPTGFVSATDVKDDKNKELATVKNIVEFARFVNFDPKKILVNPNPAFFQASFYRYCPILSIVKVGKKDAVKVEDNGEIKSLRIGKEIKKSDIYVLKEEFEEFLNPDFADDDSNSDNTPMKEEVSEAYLNPDFRDDDDETTPAITGAGVAADEPTVTTASPVQETVTEEEPAKVDYSNMKVTELKAELKKRGLKVGGLKSELVKRLEDDDKEDANASDEKEESKEEYEESKEMKSDLFGKPLSGNIDEVIARGLTVKSKSGKLYKVTARAKNKKFKGIDLATGKPTTIQIKGARINSLMSRFEAFDGIDGLVPALPAIRIPERHEMM